MSDYPTGPYGLKAKVEYALTEDNTIKTVIQIRWNRAGKPSHDIKILTHKNCLIAKQEAKTIIKKKVAELTEHRRIHEELQINMPQTYIYESDCQP